MKKDFLLLFLFFSIGVRAQWVSIPDTGFGTWLNTHNYSACLQGNNSVGWQMDTTCPAVVNASYVSCTSGNIHDLRGISYFDNLQTLYCYNNQLSNLPALPTSLSTLRCYNNQLSSLPALPNSLRTLWCFLNPLGSLPALPSGLIELSCYSNQLSTLPTLPVSLSKLVCYSNQLNNLPVLPAGLTYLSCGTNQLSTLPALPPTLTSLMCASNQLSNIPAFPDSLEHCEIFGNPLSCLPQLKRIVTLYFHNTNISCLPNYGHVTYSYPALSTLPLCELLNANDCEVYWNIKGKIYYDENSNCSVDSSESAMNNIPVRLLRNEVLLQQMVTLSSGNYSFGTDTFGIYTLSADTSNIPFNVTCPANNLLYDTITTVDSLHYKSDFALGCKSSFDLAAWSIAGVFIPGNLRKVIIHTGDLANFYGARCASGVSGTVQLEISGSVSYASPAPGSLTPSSVVNNVVTWSIADFGAVNFFTDFNIMVQTDTNAVIGTKICFTLTITPTTGDNNPTNNTFTICFPVVASFDPNDKQVYPEADIEPTLEWLTYTIRFQNTGTAEAQHIYVDDTLDSDLDYSSFQLLAYSHQPMVQIKENAVRFNFPNINLPDSNTNESLSHGYVQYKIKLKDNLPIGTQINNTAYIYFDFNAPVVTNTTSNTIAVISSVGEIRNQKSEIRVYPNPANDAVTISVDESMIGGTVVVSDVTGRKMAAVQLITTHQSLTTSNFSSGVYFVTVTDKEGRSATKKLVISR